MNSRSVRITLALQTFLSIADAELQLAQCDSLLQRSTSELSSKLLGGSVLESRVHDGETLANLWGNFVNPVGTLLWNWLFLIMLACGLHVVQLLPGIWSEKQLPQTFKSGRLEALTGFRFVIALLVCCEHLGLLTTTIGGSVFVVLSGCALSTSRRASAGQLKTAVWSPSLLGRFWAQRLARIMPLYWFAWLVLEDNSSFMDAVGPLDFLQVLIQHIPGTVLEHGKELLLVSSANSHLWFVHTIAMLYLIYPALEFLVFGTKGSVSQSWLATLSSLCVLYRCVHAVWTYEHSAFVQSAWWDFYRSPILRMPDFLLGMLLPHLQPATVPHWIPFLADAAIPLFIHVVTEPRFASLPRPLQKVVEMGGPAPFYAFVVWSLCFGPCESLLGRTIKRPPFSVLGDLGYGVYIYHSSVIMAMGCFSNTMLPSCAPSWKAAVFVVTIVMGASLLLSWTTKVLIEDPVLHLVKRKFAA